jgi:serine/threonine protein kinase
MPSGRTNSNAREIGNYLILSKIAEGGMGAVYRGQHRTTEEIVAIKIIPAETARNPLLLRRFEQEFRAASLIDHPNVVKAIEYCGTGPSPFLVMEFVDGESLGDKVEREGALPEDLAVHYIAQVCEGLYSAHKQGLIHRDIKPDNILVTQDGIAKITDLGLVKDVEGELNLTKTGKGLGTPHFMAPEQFRNAKNADVRCDVYSIGATMYMLVTGQIPFDKTSPLDCWLRKTRNELPTPQSLIPTLSDRVDFAIRRAMAPQAADRSASCREFMEDLTGQRWRPGQPVSIKPPSSASVETPSEAYWYMVYYDVEHKQRKVKGTTDTIRANALAGTLGDMTTILVSRSKAGPFMPFKQVAEFRDLILSSSESLGGSSSTRLPSKAFTTPSMGVPIPPEAINRVTNTPETLVLSYSTSRVVMPEATPSPEAKEAFLNQLVEPHEPNPMQGKTDPLTMVPLTDAQTISLGTDERPALPVQHTDKIPRDQLVLITPSHQTLWLYVSLALGLIVGLALAFII